MLRTFGLWNRETSAIWGLMRTVCAELPSLLSVICMDTDANTQEIGFQAASELLAAQRNIKRELVEVAYRGKTRYCRRLKPSRVHTIGPVALRLEKRGQLSDLATILLNLTRTVTLID